MLRAEHPGHATIGETKIEGHDLTLERFNVNGEVEVRPGAARIGIEHNRITGGYFGIDACYASSSSAACDDVRIIGNQLVGPYGEDGIRANRYHDANGDGIGLLVEGNEITQVRENGNHSDCIQTVWVGDHLVFRRNYLHDNRCQGFFVKDQESTIEGIRLEDNLFVRDNEPCAPNYPSCGQPNYVNVYGPYTDFAMKRNTIWQGSPTTAFRTSPGPNTVIDSNVVRGFGPTPISRRRPSRTTRSVSSKAPGPPRNRARSLTAIRPSRTLLPTTTGSAMGEGGLGTGRPALRAVNVLAGRAARSQKR